MLSGLVFPGAGQIAQKRYARGVFFILAVLVATGALMVAAVRQAMAILDQILDEGVDMDLASMADAAIRASAKAGGSLYKIALLAIVVAWIASIVDAWLTGRKMDAAAAVQPPPLPPHEDAGNSTT